MPQKAENESFINNINIPFYVMLHSLNNMHQQLQNKQAKKNQNPVLESSEIRLIKKSVKRTAF